MPQLRQPMARGKATGPHLHYEIIEDGRPVDPATTQLAGAELEEFQQERQAILAQVVHLAPLQEIAWAE